MRVRLGVIAILLLAPSVWAQAQDAQQVSAEVAEALRQAMEAWADERQWTLWEMGTQADRTRIGQNEFADRLRHAAARPAAGRPIEILGVQLRSATEAMATVRFGLERRPDPTVSTQTASFVMRHEDGRWRLPLPVFLQLAQHRWYPQGPSPPYLPHLPLFNR